MGTVMQSPFAKFTLGNTNGPRVNSAKHFRCFRVTLTVVFVYAPSHGTGILLFPT